MKRKLLKINKFRDLEEQWNETYSKVDTPMGEEKINKIQKIVTEKECIPQPNRPRRRFPDQTQAPIQKESIRQERNPALGEEEKGEEEREGPKKQQLF